MAKTPSTMLALGTRAPDFQLPDTEGTVVSRDDSAAAPGLLVMFLCNHCPYVKHIRGGLAALRARLRGEGSGDRRRSTPTTSHRIPTTARRR